MTDESDQGSVASSARFGGDPDRTTLNEVHTALLLLSLILCRADVAGRCHFVCAYFKLFACPVNCRLLHRPI